MNQVNGHTEALNTSGKAASDPSPPERKDGNGSVCNGDVSPLEREELCMIPSRSQPRTGTTSLDRHGDLKHPAELEEETGIFSSAPSTSMLSSTVVTVLAPHRNGRLRRFKRSEENGGSEAQEGTNSALEPLRETVDKSLMNASRVQLRMPFSSSRQNTVGCTTDADYETRRKITQTASLDVSAARIGKREAASSNPLSPLPLNPNEQRTSPQAGLPGVPCLSLKPTSSSLLLSLRRSNCNVRNSTETPTLSEKNRLSQRTLDCNRQATKGPESPSISYRTIENGPVRSPSPSNPNQTTTFKAQLLSASPAIKGTAVPHPAQAKISADSPPRRASYDHSPLPKAQPVPRRTTLTSTSWWKQVTQDKGCPLTSSDTFKNTPLASPSPNVTDVSRCDRDINNTIPDIREPSKSHSLPGSSPGSKTSDTSSSFQADALPSHTNIQAFPNGGTFPQTLRLSKTFNSSPLGFERSYASIPFHLKTASALIPSLSTYPQTKCGHVTTASSTSHTAVCSTSPPSPSVASALPSTPTTTISSSLLTPPATPIASSPSYCDSSSPNDGRTLSSSQEEDSRNKNPRAEGKKARRVTWEDSVDVQQSQKLRAEKAEPSNLPADSPPPRHAVSIKAPSIFSLLRPSNQTSPVCSRTPKISSVLVGKAGKCRSLSSDSAHSASRLKETSEQTPSDCVVSNQGRQNLTTSRHERTLSLESATAQRCCSGSLSLPPELSAGYKLRYSSPPYTTLMSNRTAQKEAKPIIPRSVLHQPPSQPSYRHLSPHTDPISASPAMETVQTPVSPPQSLALPFQANANIVATRGVSLQEQDNNNYNRNQYQDRQNGQISPVSNRVQVSPQGLHGSPSAFITETLVYCIETKADPASAPKVTLRLVGHPANPPLSAETQLSPRPVLGQSNRAADLSEPGFSANSLTEAQTSEDENSKRGSKEGMLGKSRYFSMEGSHEQIQKRGRFALKRSTSTPNSNLSRSNSDRSNKTNTKMDQMVNRLKKTFSTKRSEDDLSFPWKWRRTSQTPPVNGDVSGVSVGSADSPKVMQEEEKELSMKDKESEAVDRCAPVRCTLTPPAACENTTAGDGCGVWSCKPSPNSDSKGRTGVEQMCVNQPHSPTTHHFHSGIDYKPSNQFLSCRDPSPGRGPAVSSAAYPTQTGKSTPSPRSPFSPFSSLSPVSSIPSSDVTDEVFYSPKLPRRREPASPCEPGEGFSLTGSRRSRASTGPPSVSLSPENEYFASSCADLKYGIEPGRSYCVSSVLSSRPSRPGRISTGSRVMSVGSLCECTLSYAGNNQHLDVECDGPHWAMESNCRMGKGFQMYCTKNSTKMRSRSLPRSLTKYLSSWKSGVSPPSLGDALTAHPAHLVNPNVSGSHFTWDAEGPPTPPPTPPLSPLARRMSKPPSPSSPKFPSSPGSPQQLDGLPGGNLPSRGHKTSLSRFDESSDNSSETTTDDEYYLETGEEEKETEL